MTEITKTTQQQCYEARAIYPCNDCCCEFNILCNLQIFVDNKLDKFKALLKKYWDKIENWATSDLIEGKKLMEYENQALEVENELIKIFNSKI